MDTRQTAAGRKWFLLALCATVAVSIMIVPSAREAIVWEARHLVKGPEQPEPPSSPGPFPGEQHPPEGPYLEVQVLSLALLQTGHVEARLRLTPRNGLGPVRVREWMFGTLLAQLKLWTEDAKPVGCRWHRVLVDPIGPPATTAIEAAGTEVTERSLFRVDLVTGPAHESLQPGKLLYIIDWRCDWTYDAMGAKEAEGPVWGQGKVPFVKQ